MENLKEEIKQLLFQDMVFEMEFKEKVINSLDSLNETQLQKILKTLKKLVGKEAEVIEHILETKPYFFIEIQHEILNIMHEEFEKEEHTCRQQAEIQLQQDLATLK